jgi:tetratricopeptide (TPR) repeat protein
MERRGDLQGAMARLQEAEKLSRQLDDKSILRNILVNKAKLFVATGRPIEAIQRLKEVETISQELQDFKELVYASFRQAALYSSMIKMPAAASPGMKQAQQLAEAHGLTAMAEEIKKTAHEIRARKA